LLQFDLSGVPEGAEVVSAVLKIRAVLSTNSNRIYMTAYEVLEEWDEATVTWDSAPAYGDPAGWAWKDTPAQRSWAEFDLDPAIIAGWLANPDSNQGLIVRGEGGVNRKVEYSFASREHPTVGIRPQLIVEYSTS